MTKKKNDDFDTFKEENPDIWEAANKLKRVFKTYQTESIRLEGLLNTLSIDDNVHSILGPNNHGMFTVVVETWTVNEI